MKFIDELFEYYKNKLTADDEDIDLLVASLLQDFSREDMLLILAELNKEELYHITGNYLVTELRKKMINTQNGEETLSDKSTFLH
ncbi:DUF6154 family protein [Caldibacillus lycopersici]|uniref:DUF6154 family protein n=1 Tax=Perspicuibacillus lycopersici TaxID=1325689 RepID=A0AAE3LNU6_9BACI|nr:DUF6154 family protein [Perspicuibacillus lycopersici]MCU9614291.1 DUF6154 family protein [Perspicuibacillus lycopersici]